MIKIFHPLQNTSHLKTTTGQVSGIVCVWCVCVWGGLRKISVGKSGLVKEKTKLYCASTG